MSKYSDYKIINIKPIGSGGNADVYLAKKNGDSKIVALKVLKSGGRYFNEKRDRFCIESSLVEKIQDEISGIIPIYDSGLPDIDDKNKYWYTMPLAIPLEKKINKDSSLDEIANCILELSKVMIKLHQRGIVHRDIKPSNIYHYNGAFCFGDFGLVDYPGKENLTKKNESVGPKATIAPEMKHNARISDGKKADVYSLAKTFWMLLTNSQYGFEGTYDETSNLMGLSKYYKETHLVEIENLLYESTREEPNLRPTMKLFNENLNEWLNVKADFDKSNLSQWKYVQKKLFGEIIPDRAFWSDKNDIVKVLNLLARMPNLNHMFIPGGGGIDLTMAELASEENCISMRGNGTSIVSPYRLIAENISKDYIWSYFRLELNELSPILAKEETIYEQLTEDLPGHYISPLCGNYGFYEDDTVLPDGYRNVSRFIRGSFVIFLKTSIYNRINGTYDGRHNKMDTEMFRSYIENTRKMFLTLSYPEFIATLNTNPYKDKEENKDLEDDVKRLIKTDDYIENNFMQWNFNDVLCHFEKKDDSLLSYSLNFNHSSTSWQKYSLDINGRLIEKDFFDKDTSNDFKVYCRNDILRLIDNCRKHIIEESNKNGIDFLCYEKLFEVELQRIGKPHHLFSKDELIDILKKGDDHRHNTLVIDEYGYFHLLQDEDATTYPVRFEGFCAYNNYVGKYAMLTNLEDEYQMALEGWLSYLANRQSVYMDYVRYKHTVHELITQINEFY